VPPFSNSSILLSFSCVVMKYAPPSLSYYSDK
jgi:hypothetical protein